MHMARSLRSRWLLGSSLVVLGVGVLLQTPRGVARDAPEGAAGRCTNRNVAGTYGFVGSGTILANDAGFPEGPVVTVGLQTFDGAGTWVTQQTLMVNGHVSPGVSLRGSYAVNPDCTFTQEDTAGNTNAGVFVHDRHEAWLMETIDGLSVTVTLKRIRTHDTHRADAMSARP